MAKQTVNIGSAANDGTGDGLRTAFDKFNDNFDEMYTEVTAPVPQFEVAAGQTLALTRATHQGATITLAGAGATISFSATTQGNGFAFTLYNETGSAWTVPTFTGGTNRFAKNATHTQVEVAGGASFEVVTWGGTRRVRINGDTV